MKLSSQRRCKKGAFTLVEIALCIGIIGFALVAIIGILPAGLQVQRDNREDTIINQEASYLLEAIRNGAEELDYTNGMMRLVELRTMDRLQVLRTINEPPVSNLVALLSRPSERPMWQNPNDTVPIEVRAIIRPTVGSAADGGEVAFEYQVVARNFALTNLSSGLDPRIYDGLPNYAREVRLELRWPILPGDRVGSGRQVFRALISGRLEPDPRVPRQPDGTVINPGDDDLWFFRQ